MKIELAFRRVEDSFEDEETYLQYIVITYLLVQFDGDCDEDDRPIDAGDVIDQLFEFVANSSDKLVKSTDNLNLEFLDPESEDIYRIDKLEEVFAEDVKRFGDELASLINMEKIRLKIKNRIHDLD